MSLPLSSSWVGSSFSSTGRPWFGRWPCPRRCSFTSSSGVSSAGDGPSRPWPLPATFSCCWL
ncbi:hypothetical protein EVA_17995 [gut metagenome]|uniref:Uncharacterized protein n=1 Tax=gut metagenome TaxID=749906 RepID=J9FWF4_9ZZZZ